MSDKSRGRKRRQENEWARQRKAKESEREAARQAKLAALKASVSKSPEEI
jgi:hypothetical protein